MKEEGCILSLNRLPKLKTKNNSSEENILTQKVL